MNEQDFGHPGAPGRLEPTAFQEQVITASGALRFREVTGSGYVPNPLPAGLTKKEVVAEVYDHLVGAERSLSRLEGMAGRLENPGLLIGPFASKEARHSSAIENTFASDEQLALFGVDESTVDPTRRPEVLEVRNYLRALQHGFADPRPICLNLIKEMHAILLDGSTRTAGRQGEFRTTQNAIGDPESSFRSAKFVPPPPRFLDGLLQGLELFINDNKSDLPRLVRFALTHYQFECIHPFDDGNGRLGRLIIALQLCKQGQLPLPLVYVSGFLESHREQYYRLLYSVSAEGTWHEWIRFFLAAVTSQCDDARKRAELLDHLRSDYHSRVMKKRASAMLPKVIDTLFTEYPAITVARVAEIAGMRQPSAGNLVRKLLDAGILREATGRKHYRVFLADGVMAAMNVDLGVPESAEPPPQTLPGAES